MESPVRKMCPCCCYPGGSDLPQYQLITRESKRLDLVDGGFVSYEGLSYFCRNSGETWKDEELKEAEFENMSRAREGYYEKMQAEWDDE